MNSSSIILTIPIYQMPSRDILPLDKGYTTLRVVIYYS